MGKPYLSIIIPSYNEAERIPLTLLDIDARLARAAYSYEILVVNDGSNDATAPVVRALQKTVRNLVLVDNTENKGKGSVVRQGMLIAKGAIRLFTDADNSTTIDQFEAMRPYFREGYGAVIGSRAVKGAKLEPAEPFMRQVFGKGLNLVVQALLLPGVWDTQCGFKAFTAEVAEAIFTGARITGWGFDVEALCLAKAMGYRIKEMPVLWRNDARSRVKASAGLEFLMDISKVRISLWMKKYALKINAPGSALPPL